MATLTAQEKSRVDKYLHNIAKLSLELADKFYIILSDGVKFDIPGPFRRAVDVTAFPTYSSIVKEPMDMSKMKKRIENLKSIYLNSATPSTNGGTQFIIAIKRDMELIRSNAHLFNSDPASADVRYMADYLRNYFCYCLRIFLKLLQAVALHNDCYEKYNQYVFNGKEIQDFLKEETTDDTRAFLTYSGNRNKFLDFIEKETLVPSILGNRFPLDLRKSIAVICEVKPPSKNSFFTAVQEVPPPASAQTTATTSGKKSAAKNVAKSPAEPSLKLAVSSTAVNDIAGSMKSPSGKSKRKLEEVVTEGASIKVPPKKRNAGKSSNNNNIFYGEDAEELDIDTPSGQSYLVDQSSKKYPSKAIAASGEYDYNEGFVPMDEDEDLMITFATGPGSGKTTKKGGAAGGGKLQSQKSRQSSIGGNLATAATATTPMPIMTVGSLEWYKTAEEIVKLLLKHPYIDINRPTVAADFYNPVIETYPAMKDVYLSRIEEPMDFRTIQELLLQKQFYHPEEFYAKLRRIFSNAIDYNMDNMDTSDVLKKIVEKSTYLLSYVEWLCLEKLPLVDDQNPQELATAQAAILAAGLPQNFTLILTITARNNARKQREELVFDSFVNEFQNLAYPMITSATNNNRSEITRIAKEPMKECKATVLELMRARGRREEINVGNFICPVNIDLVPDYMVFVRCPMDLSTLQYRLDGTTSRFDHLIDKSIGPNSYETYGEFFRDCRLIYENAIHYNKAHLQSDNTGISLEIHDLATQYLEKLDEMIIPKQTLSLADRISVCRYLLAQDQTIIEEQKRKEEEDRRSKNLLLQKIIEEKKATDDDFAQDIDPEFKRRRTEVELQELERAEKKKRMQQATATLTLLGNMSPMDDMSDVSSPSMSPDHLPQSNGIASENITIVQKPKLPLIYGYDVLGNVPKRFEEFAKEKAAIVKQAWLMWPKITHTVVSHHQSSSSRHYHHASSAAGENVKKMQSQGMKMPSTGGKEEPSPAAKMVSDNQQQQVQNAEQSNSIEVQDNESLELKPFSKIVVKKKQIHFNQQLKQIFDVDE
jgi:uncharacterized protein (UPF0305 family)